MGGPVLLTCVQRAPATVRPTLSHPRGVYTLQMVVDGRTDFVGSDARSAESAIRDALGQPKVAVRITASEGAADIEIDPLPAGRVHKAAVFVAFAADAGTQDVLRGENRGRHIRHVSTVKT